MVELAQIAGSSIRDDNRNCCCSCCFFCVIHKMSRLLWGEKRKQISMHSHSKCVDRLYLISVWWNPFYLFILKQAKLCVNASFFSLSLLSIHSSLVRFLLLWNVRYELYVKYTVIAAFIYLFNQKTCWVNFLITFIQNEMERNIVIAYKHFTIFVLCRFKLQHFIARCEYMDLVSPKIAFVYTHTHKLNKHYSLRLVSMCVLNVCVSFAVCIL